MKKPTPLNILRIHWWRIIGLPWVPFLYLLAVDPSVPRAPALAVAFFYGVVVTRITFRACTELETTRIPSKRFQART